MNRLSLGVLLVCAATLACDGVVGELGAADQPPQRVDPSSPRITRFDCTPVTGDAPLKVTCQLEVMDPQGKPVSCSVDLGNGDAPTAIADCLNPQQLELNYAKAGQYLLKVLASDPDLASSTATVAITVTQRPNQPPVIDDFSASPTLGGAPYTSTLSWKVSDPEGDLLTCKLNDMPVDCAMLSAPWTVSMVGSVTVTLTVTDAYGGTVSKTLTLTAVMPVGDVKISKVEWGQTVVATDLKLVAQKAALLRVYVLADKSTFTGIQVEARGKLGTTDLGKLMLVGPATVPTAETPTDLTQQWTVTLPPEWIASGLEVTVKADSTDVLPETDEMNNLQALKPMVGKANVMMLTSVPVVHQGTMPTIAPLEGPLTQVWPLKGIDSVTRAPYTFSGTLTGTNATAWGTLLDDIAQVRQIDGSSRNYYGFVKVSYGSGVAGIGYISQEAAVGRDDSIETAQHELGHNMSRQHAPCGNPAGPDPNFPYAGASIGSWGYDAVAKRLVNPASTLDLMSYCNPVWVSDYNYQGVQTYLEAQPYIPPSPSTPNVTMIAVSGRFGPNGITLRPVHRVRAPLPADVPFSARTLKVRFVDGAECEVRLQAHRLADLDTDEESFFALVEDRGAIAGIEVVDGDRRVFSGRPIFTPEAAPQVKLSRASAVELQVEWDATLYPYAAVAHLTDAQRTTLALSLQGGRGRVRLDGLGAGMIELSLSEGLDATRVLLPMPAP
jgi:PKD repeat protein